MEGRDVVFGNALESIEENIRKQDVEEKEAIEAKKKGKTDDPLKAGKPKDLSKEGEKDNKLHPMENKETSEGINPDDYKDDEGKKIEKLTEKDVNVAEDVKQLIAKAKEALDSGNYEEAQNLVSRLSQVKAAVSEPEKVEPENIGVEMPAVDVEEPMEETPGNPTDDVVHEQFIMDDKLQEMIDKALDAGAGFGKMDEAKKKDPKAKLRNRGDVVFPAESPKVMDDKDHFPINSEKQARNALARANQYSSSPKWYKGSLDSLVKKVASAVQKKYKDIEVTKKAKTPGKG
jgi:hypothetical protein